MILGHDFQEEFGRFAFCKKLRILSVWGANLKSFHVLMMRHEHMWYGHHVSKNPMKIL